MLEASAEPVEFRDHECVAGPQLSQRPVELGTGPVLAGGVLDEHPLAAIGLEDVRLPVGVLLASRHPRVPQIHPASVPNLATAGSKWHGISEPTSGTLDQGRLRTQSPACGPFHFQGCGTQGTAPSSTSSARRRLTGSPMRSRRRSCSVCYDLALLLVVHSGHEISDRRGYSSRRRSERPPLPSAHQSPLASSPAGALYVRIG